MESSIVRQLGKKFYNVIDQQLLKHGKVLDVRHWPRSPIVEVDLHLPAADMQHWKEVPYIKFDVGTLCFRDYTPFGWDTETSTCSLLIDTAHNGLGSIWARKLQEGDSIQYLKISGSRQAPHMTNFVVGLGDNSSLAHLLALQQLTMPATRFVGVVLTNSLQTGCLLSTYFGRTLVSHIKESDLVDWIVSQHYCVENTSFYLTGSEHLVVELRKTLKCLDILISARKSFTNEKWF